jgi:hypothetical protein
VVNSNHHDGLNGENRSSVFEVRSIVETRFIRIRMIDRNWAGNQYLYFRAFEVFGGLRFFDSMKFTSINHIQIKINLKINQRVVHPESYLMVHKSLFDGIRKRRSPQNPS